MTEDEAKTKWCPMAKQVAIDGDMKVLGSTSFNRTSKPDGSIVMPSSCFCIGSACMAWKEIKIHKYELGEVYQTDITGYCGLAGKP